MKTALSASSSTASIGLTWWQTLLVTSVPAFITAVLAGMSLIIQARTSARLERERLIDKQAERTAQQAAERESSTQEIERAARERRHALNDHWRAERREAHWAFSAAAYKMYESLQQRPAATAGEPSGGLWTYQPEDDDESHFKHTFSHVQLVASLPAQRCAEAVYDFARGAKFEVTLQGLEAEGIGDPALLKREWNAAIADYRSTAREDLGTQD